mmetsp:Transcript_2420/g.3599  ORF Transcript_2420/g.3599 Transcript_2420/m.3599 type:complete len:418 (-) Transcript_2420:405-1658(-)|eukprot:CAMPEP_0195519220 /NCGR_PEP_ID=MMETSP0794_2-20130614/14522_1 /TAXON_ID=515487 /ORGANISM="Stephanopyxis turris, Strain CCMP 815" /LENGTH=417 /DNA_ID=CAMNT_0040648343 /DNA_START=144 /DNA_END=1397 /DNA_ORIENTATION=+
MSNNPLLGNRISLISKRDIRYEGTLYSINESDATVALQNVRTFGTEGREKNCTPPGTFVPPMNDMHPYLVFRGCDIKDLHVHDAPTKPPPPPPDDPAIISGAVPPNVLVEQQKAKGKDKSTPKEKGETGSKPTQSTVDANGSEGSKNKGSAKQNGSSAPATISSDEKPSRRKDPSWADQQDEQDEQREKQISYREKQPGTTNFGKSASDGVDDTNSKEKYNGQRKQHHQSKQSSERPSNGYKNNSRYRRTRKNDMQVGTGASLLHRKERGAVENNSDPAAKNDFDFESSAAGFEKAESDFENAPNANEAVYTKDDFFDSISCDAIDRRDGVDNRLRGAQERKMNTETFGAVSLTNNRRGGRRYRRRGGGGGGRGRGGDHGDRSGPPRQNQRWKKGPSYNRQFNGQSNHTQTARAGCD